MDRISLSRALLDDCERAYGGIHGQSFDLPSFQSVETYRQPGNQQKYVHMYFAKHVALWREVRRRLPGLPPVAVGSFGAGPGLCVLGWFWDTPPASPAQVGLVDVLDWAGVRSLPSHQTLLHGVLGGYPICLTGCLDLGQTKPAQLEMLGNTQAIRPPERSIVLLSFLANHVVGAIQPIEDTRAFWSTLWGLAADGRTVIVADLDVAKAPKIWSEAPVKPGTFHFDPTWLQGAYVSQAERRVSPYMRTASVLMGDASGWRSL
jgi:hypothetical protein